MDTVCDIHTRQINVMSGQLFVQTAHLAQLQEQMTLIGTQLQRTQLHISTVDARVPSFLTITAVIRVLVCKINDVVTRLRSPSEAEQRVMLADLEAINMELAMGDLMKENTAPRNTTCECEWNQLCNQCFPN
jgi:hypothetical protein